MLTLGARPVHTYHIDCTLRDLRHLARLKTSCEVRAPFAQILEMTHVTAVRGALQAVLKREHCVLPKHLSDRDPAGISDPVAAEYVKNSLLMLVVII